MLAAVLSRMVIETTDLHSRRNSMEVVPSPRISIRSMWIQTPAGGARNENDTLSDLVSLGLRLVLSFTAFISPKVPNQRIAYRWP